MSGRMRHVTERLLRRIEDERDRQGSDDRPLPWATIAQRSGRFTRQALSMIRHGHTKEIRVYTLEGIHNALGIPMHELLDLTGKPDNKLIITLPERFDSEPHAVREEIEQRIIEFAEAELARIKAQEPDDK